MMNNSSVDTRVASVTCDNRCKLVTDDLHVILADRDGTGAGQTLGKIGDVNEERAYAHGLVVTDPESVLQPVWEVGERFGKIEVVVNNAGIETKDPLGELSCEHWTT